MDLNFCVELRFISGHNAGFGQGLLTKFLRMGIQNDCNHYGTWKSNKFVIYNSTPENVCKHASSRLQMSQSNKQGMRQNTDLK